MNFEEFFYCSYRNVNEKETKQNINSKVNNLLLKHHCLNIPNFQKIAIITEYWKPLHPVYRTCYQQIASLKDKYHLTLITWRNKYIPEMDIFNEVKFLNTNKTLDMRSFRNSDYGLVYFPDVGMNDESIFLANIRLAPTQVTGIGHSVSTYGAKIDYYISGTDVENEDAQQYYSEKLIRIPGFGCCFKKPEYIKHNKPHNEFIINIPASKPKYNTEFIDTLAAIINGLSKKVKLQLFPVRTNIYDWVPPASYLQKKLRCEIISHTPLPYDEYMAAMEMGDLALDSFHFGGCNSVLDSFHLGIPIVTLEGNRWYNRIGPAMLKRIELEELVTQNKENYINVSKKMIENDVYRSAVTSKIRSAALDKIYNNGEEKHFRECIDKVIGNCYG